MYSDILKCLHVSFSLSTRSEYICTLIEVVMHSPKCSAHPVAVYQSPSRAVLLYRYQECRQAHRHRAAAPPNASAAFLPEASNATQNTKQVLLGMEKDGAGVRPPLPPLPALHSSCNRITRLAANPHHSHRRGRARRRECRRGFSKTDQQKLVLSFPPRGSFRTLNTYMGVHTDIHVPTDTHTDLTPPVTEAEEPFLVTALPIAASNGRISCVTDRCSPRQDQVQSSCKPVQDSCRSSEGTILWPEIPAHCKEPPLTGEPLRPPLLFWPQPWALGEGAPPALKLQAPLHKL